MATKTRRHEVRTFILALLCAVVPSWPLSAQSEQRKIGETIYELGPLHEWLALPVETRKQTEKPASVLRWEVIELDTNAPVRVWQSTPEGGRGAVRGERTGWTLPFAVIVRNIPTNAPPRVIAYRLPESIRQPDGQAAYIYDYGRSVP